MTGPEDQIPAARTDKKAVLTVVSGGIVALMVLAGCVEVPELDRAVPAWVDDAPYPDLVPIGPDITQRIPPDERASEIGDDLSARRDRLLRLARALNTPVIDDATRTRMDGGVAR
jgi:hypothetical protein